mmetsp:Transcript_41026/g.65973  ORF Transcript_41026/g.65973 Transcript_41026/m.65973 type:complete len:204 (-) Transcript_41026:727-1338(-)
MAFERMGIHQILGLHRINNARSYDQHFLHHLHHQLLIAVHFELAQLALNVPLDILQQVDIILTDKGDSSATAIDSATPSNAMNVLMRSARNIEIDHVFNLRDIQTTTRQSGRNQNVAFGAPESHQLLQSFALLHVAVQLGYFEAKVLEQPRHDHAVLLGGQEDNHRLLFLFDVLQLRAQSDQIRFFRHLRYKTVRLFDVLRGA